MDRAKEKIATNFKNQDSWYKKGVENNWYSLEFAIIHTSSCCYLLP